MKLNFSNNLRDALLEHNLTQQDLANHLGTSQATINRWIKGINEPSFSLLIEICLYLDETPNTILGFENWKVFICTNTH